MEENQYLDLIKRIIDENFESLDRTNIGTLSTFGVNMKFDLSKGFPILTTKKIHLKSIIEELLWFIKGSTDGEILINKNVNIWKMNGSREFLDQRGLNNYKENDLGPIYGFQWRHFGAEYINKDTNYDGKGFDQLQDCIDKIKNDPNNRRILLSSWNPIDIPKMALPPCHVLLQFFVKEGKLSSLLYQRSADVGLGMPFNICSYALLTHIIAQVTNLEVGNFIYNIGNAHIYINHIDKLKEQINRIPYEFPKLIINKEKKNINDFIYDDFKLENYNYHPIIKLPFAL